MFRFCIAIYPYPLDIILSSAWPVALPATILSPLATSPNPNFNILFRMRRIINTCTYQLSIGKPTSTMVPIHTQSADPLYETESLKYGDGWSKIAVIPHSMRSFSQQRCSHCHIDIGHPQVCVTLLTVLCP